MRSNFESACNAATLGGPRELAAVEPPGAEPDHLFLAIDDLERKVGPHAHDDHVDRVGTDVDGGEAHGGRAGQATYNDRPNPSMVRPPLPVRILRQRLVALLEALPAATSGDVTSVHRARVASRRLREVLPVLAEAAGSHALGRASKDVRRITRALGPDPRARRGARTSPRSRPAVRGAGIDARAVRRHLNAERLVRRRAMLDVITPRAAARLRTRLGTGPAVARTEPLGPSEIHSARRRAARRAVRLRAEIGRAGGLYDSERLHAVRVATKKLRYALEVDRELSRSRALARINRLKRLQDALGQIHDFEILIEHTREVQASLAGVDRSSATALDTLVRTLEARCRDEHAAFVGDRAALQALCQQVIEAARQGRPTFM